MRQASLNFLEKLLTTPSPSGFEQPVQKHVRAYMKNFCDEVKTDVHGNVTGVVNPGASLRVMLAGHCDEIGMMVMHIDDKGYIYFAPIGGVDVRIVNGQRVAIHNSRGTVTGVTGRKAIHMTDPDERKKEPKMHEVWIDIGAKDRKDAEKAVQIGDAITFMPHFDQMRNGLISARAFDDRVGAFVVAEALRMVAAKKLKVAVYGVSTVQEELGLRGARTSAYGIDPHAGIAVDVGFATDHPGGEPKKVGEAFLGKGPILHRGANINPVLEKMLLQAAKKHKIPYQVTGEPRATGTDANVIQINRAGAAAALVSVPNRYMHTPVEICSIDDIANACKLLAALLGDMNARVDFTPR